ncbi:MAG: HD domain-containing protein [candidate division WOR-3 bacterium]|nr:HD domain-containing protein [candidate division WOR-3 bacterium]
MNKYGKDFISNFYALIKSTFVYDFNNDVVINLVNKFFSHIKTLFQTCNQIEILRYRDYIFFNKVRMRFEVEGYASLQFIEENLKRLGIKSIVFLPGMKASEILKFASLFKLNREGFISEYNRIGFQTIVVEFYTGEDETVPEFLKDGEQIKKTYFKALKVTKNLVHNLWKRQPVDTRSFRRIIYTLIDSLSQDEFGLIALTTIKNFDEYTYNHSLNVGILSLAVGQRLDLERSNLVKLGTAGLLHDIGKVAISKSLIDKSQQLTEEEWKIMKKHSIYGVSEIIKTRGLDDISFAALLAAYEHHWNYDGSGYPERPDQKIQPNLFARIIRICDTYDAMTTSRPYQILPYLPAIAIRVIWSRTRTYFDPILTKIFIQMLGLYPVSSCIELDNGEIAVVIRQNPTHIDRPFIKIVMDKSKKKIDGPVIDLSMERKINIIRAIYPQKYDINPAQYLI